MTLLLIVFAIGLAGGSFSGFLGIGGGIITAPLLLYVPGLFGLEPLSMHLVSGLTITQSLFAGLFGAIAHRRFRTVDRKLAAVMSAVIFVAALAGAAVSKHFSHEVLLGIFALLALTAAVLIFLPGAGEEDRPDYEFGSSSLPGAAAVALAVGFLGGLVGQGGSFILIPMAVFLLKVPLRVAMGSNLVIVFFASLAGFIGKAATGQVVPLLALALLAGIIPGTKIGSEFSHRVPTRILRYALGTVIIAACVKIAADLAS
ncbi:sulfite exporter TauE/SafE family protein [Candidatus Moduliflexota bacterium]